MKRIFTLLALLPMFLWSCSENFIEQENPKQPINESRPDLTAAFADVATRTYVENDKYLRWHEDDRLSVFYGNTLNDQYKFKGQTGDNSGTFALVPSGELGTGNTLPNIFAIYPYNADARISDEGVISLTLPAMQTYAENSFGNGANTMIAVTENLEDTFLVFKNVCGYLKLKLYDPDGGGLKSVTIKGNNNEKIAGAATATVKFGEAPVTTMTDEATNSVTLDCGEGILLGTSVETATELWIVLPETIFTKGITIIATDVDGGTFEKSTSKEVIIERNTIQPMAAVECVLCHPETWKIYYTATEKIKPYPYNNDDVFGAKIISNEWNEFTMEGVIAFDSTITTIGERAFRDCSCLTNITIPESVTTIGGGAFADCSSLTTVTIGDSVTTIGGSAFSGCRSLTSITIPDSVTLIGGYAFFGCRSLTSVTIPESVIEIGEGAFMECGFTSINIPNGVTTIADGTFQDCHNLINVTIPDSVIHIGSNAFRCCDSLTHVKLPDSLMTIGYSAFHECTSLTDIVIPNGVMEIGSGIFYDCTNLHNVTIPNTITSIGSNAFYGCNNLSRVDISDLSAWCNIGFNNTYSNPLRSGVTKLYLDDKELIEITSSHDISVINNYAFFNYLSLTNVTLTDSVTTIGRGAFEGCINLTSVTIGDSVTTIGYEAFRSCDSLTSVTIGNSVTTIGSYAFFGCDNLARVNIYDLSAWCKIEFWDNSSNPVTYAKSLYLNNTKITDLIIPTDITEIKPYTFFNCESLISVTIPENITIIGNYALYSCDSLKYIYCKATIPPTLGLKPFFEYISKIYVPASADDSIINTYKVADRWSSYSSRIYEYDFE